MISHEGKKPICRVATKVVLCIASLLLVASCTVYRAAAPSKRPEIIKKELPVPIGYTIQAGAFSNVDNASRLTDCLNGYGLDAYYFVYKSGLYKVRFGDFATQEIARAKAQELKDAHIIEEFYIVRPDELSLARRGTYGERYVRQELVKTARSFLGIPYKWGAASEDEGFDCSGLAMSVYRLNGLRLPRTSWRQYECGEAVDFDSLAEGDLVFFDTKGSGNVSHVGIYAGDGYFIHAPRTGKHVRVDELLQGFYYRCYIGGRSYL